MDGPKRKMDDKRTVDRPTSRSTTLLTPYPLFSLVAVEEDYLRREKGSDPLGAVEFHYAGNYTGLEMWGLHTPSTIFTIIRLRSGRLRFISPEPDWPDFQKLF